MKLENVPYFTQRDNADAPAYSCFPTSIGMAVAYCLASAGKSKTDIGCPPLIQIEDYINHILKSAETKKWMKDNEYKLGSWIWNYNPREIFPVEAYVFNALMNAHGFKAEHRVVTFAQLCAAVEKFPVVVGGNFKSVSSVGAHVICIVGYDGNSVIANDPYGNALTRYNDRNGEGVVYSKMLIGNNAIIITEA